MIRLAIVDDKVSNRNILSDKLRHNASFDIIFQAVNGEDFLEKMRESPADKWPHIVLMDLEMPVLDGVITIANASALYAGVKFVVLTIFDDDDKIFSAIRAGACGYILKEESREVINEMIMNLWQSGAGPISPSIAYKILQMIQHPSLPESAKNSDVLDVFKLSDREKEILKLLSEGLDNKELASRIGISPNTVKKHCSNIYTKLHVSSKAQALRIAYTKGFV